jgi:hypothetical protein
MIILKLVIVLLDGNTEVLLDGNTEVLLDGKIELVIVLMKEVESMVLIWVPVVTDCITVALF